MRIYGDNLITTTTLIASSEKSGYKVDNLKVPQLRRRQSFDGNSGNIVIIFPASPNIKHCIIDIGNMTSSATVTLEGNSSDSWTSPPYSQAMTRTDSCFYLDLDETYKYFRLVIEDTTLTYVEFGYISIGDTYTQMPSVNPSVELFYNTTAENSFSIGGQVSGDDGYEYLDTTFTFPMIEEDGSTFSGVTCAGRKEILSLWKKIRNVTPVWVMLWANSLDEFAPVFCIFNQKKMSFIKSDVGYYSVNLALREVL